jgi:MFS transporter, PAT family, beta-lactamase induction signal transducer AmpG
MRRSTLQKSTFSDVSGVKPDPHFSRVLETRARHGRALRLVCAHRKIMEPSECSARRAWSWVPSLYFSQGLPYVTVMTLAVVMYKNLGISNTDIALYTSWLYLPWVIKPLWSPMVDLHRTKRFWIVSLQFLLGVTLALVALTVPAPLFFRLTLAVFWLLAFASATHDIAADGFYLLALPASQQAAFVGVRSTFYRCAMIAGQGGLVALAGWLQQRTGNPQLAWSLVFGGLAAYFGLLGWYHFVILPRPANDRPAPPTPALAAASWTVFVAFFRKPQLPAMLAFLLLYRFAESQLVKLVPPFLLDPRSAGGLGLSTQEVGFAYGTVGVLALVVGGLLGGYAIARGGLRRMLWPMAVAINVPNFLYVWLAWAQPASLAVISTAIAIEQLGYGFGFAAYLVYMMKVAQGEHQTAHYAIGTGFMALGMMLPGMGAGWLQDKLGYAQFFTWVGLATIPSFIATALIKVDADYGRKA